MRFGDFISVQDSPDSHASHQAVAINANHDTTNPLCAVAPRRVFSMPPARRSAIQTIHKPLLDSAISPFINTSTSNRNTGSYALETSAIGPRNEGRIPIEQ